MATHHPGTSPTAIVLPFPSRTSRPDTDRICRVVPDFEGNCLLYSHHALSLDKLFAIKILCWAELADGRYVALVPWLTGVSRCTDLQNASTGKSQGYYAPALKRTFSEIPPQYRAALAHLPQAEGNPNELLQQLPDLVGTHAALVKSDTKEFALEPVVSWCLYGDGRMEGMIADQDKATQFPVLADDACLYSAQQHASFRYFFQYHIANQIKAGGEIATRVLNELLS